MEVAGCIAWILDHSHKFGFDSICPAVGHVALQLALSLQDQQPTPLFTEQAFDQLVPDLTSVHVSCDDSMVVASMFEPICDTL